MNDDLEDFIHQNRNDFDDKELPAEVWKTVESTLPNREKKSWWNSAPVWRAAAIIFMVLSGYLLMPKHAAKPQHSDVNGRDFDDVEAFYVEQISEKVELIDGFKRNENLNAFTQEFKQLEAMYFVLKEEMKNRPSQKVKDALVLNLLVRIDLLNQQLHSLEKQNTEEKKIEKV